MIFDLQFSLGLAAGLGLALLAAAPAQADALWVASGGGALQIGDVQILDIAEGQILFKTRGGEARRELSQVTRIQVDQEPALSAAEEALAAGRNEAAIDDYLKALRISTKPWVQRWSAQRLLGTANKVNRFDASVAAFVALVRVDPAVALENRPDLPVGSAGFLASAAKDLETALADPKLNPTQKQALLSFLLEIQKARGESRAAAAVAEQMLKLASETNQDPAAAAAIADLKLSQAQSALEKQDYKQALDLIETNRPIFREPRQQVVALYVLAEARAGLLGPGADARKLRDLALDYMRVVAHFEHSGHELVPAALLKVAQLHEQFGQPRAALSLYEQLASQYNSSPAAEEAGDRASALRAELAK